MIPLSTASLKTESWQQQLADGYCSIRELLSDLELSAHFSPAMEKAAGAFPFRLPRYFAALMKKGDPHDPLLLQVLPVAAELQLTPGFTTDPLQDEAAYEGHGILHKYQGRVLLIATGTCAVNCRYCFRRHFPYAGHQALKNEWRPTLARLRKDTSIREVILSGGDPLVLSNDRLKKLIDALADIPHIRRLRIHTRLPVVLPVRLDSGLIEILGNTPLASSLVIHANHPRELTAVLAQALTPLRRAGVTLLNQSVLLRHINDDLRTQVTLSEALYELGVLPYYLHQLDPVQGAAHFAVDDHSALMLHRNMERQLPGYLLPRLVREIPGAPSKQTLPGSQNRKNFIAG